MDELGGYRELAPPARLIGNAVFVGMLVLTTLLERLQLQLRATESSRWWASNGRDAVNAFAVASMALGLKVIGFTGPMAFLVASILVLLMSALQPAIHRPQSMLLSLGLALVLGLPVLVAPSWVHSFFRRLLEMLFR